MRWVLRHPVLDFPALGEALGVSKVTAWRYCLPPTDQRHCQPGRKAAERLRKLTQGKITVGNYADPAEQRARAARRRTNGNTPKRGRA